jgi:spore maturation protein CgeB
MDRARSDGHPNVVLTQWAARDTTLAQPLPTAHCRYRVSFVGSAYGNRRRWIEQLSQRGIEVDCFGYGWPKGPVAAADIPRIVRESAVSLNFGDSGLHLRGLRPYRSRQIKARVFEVPGAGGFLLTETADGLEHFFRDGSEIAVFRDADELAEKARFYLDHPDERDRIALAGHERCARSHTYTRRFEELLMQATHLKTHRNFGRSGGVKELSILATKHRPSPSLRLLRAILVSAFSLVFGRRRGARAARRFLFELSWRIAGARTYSASGWPGRIFYRES